MSPVPDLRVGWQASEPGPVPRSPLLNHPPSPSSTLDLITAHNNWRRAVESDEVRLATAHSRLPIWFPVRANGCLRVVPVMGGTPASWDLLIASLAIAAGDAGFKTTRIANLLPWPVLSSLQDVGRKARRIGLRFDSISPTGSTIDVFSYADVEDLSGFLVDVLRVVSDAQGRRDSAREKSDLIEIGRLLEPPRTLERLTDALDLALGQMAKSSTSSFTKTEERDLRDFHARVVSQRAQTANRLDGLQADLRELVHYRLNRAKSAVTLGVGPARVRAVDVDQSRAIHEFEMGRELLARSMARAFARPSPHPELLVVAGADKLAPEALDNLRGTAERLGKTLFLLFSEVTRQAQRCLGAGGSGFAMFLRLPNADDAELAARHLGKDYVWVVNGISIADGQTESWNASCARSQSTTSTRGSNSGRSSNWSLDGLSFGRSFGRHVAESFGNTTSETQGIGGATTQTRTQTSARLHEYALEPEEFQNLAEDAVLVVEGRRVVLANCDFRLRNDPLTSPLPLVGP